MCHLGFAFPSDRAAKDRLPRRAEPAQAPALPTDHFPLGAEEGVTLEILIVLALGDVGKHFAVHLVRCAVGDPERRVGNVTKALHGGLTTSRTPTHIATPLSSRQPALPLYRCTTPQRRPWPLGLASWAIHDGGRTGGKTGERATSPSTEPHPKIVIAEPLLYTRQCSDSTSLNSELPSEKGFIIIPTFQMRILKLAVSDHQLVAERRPDLPR